MSATVLPKTMWNASRSCAHSRWKPRLRATSVDDDSGRRSPVSAMYSARSPPCTVRGTACTRRWPRVKSSKKLPVDAFMTEGGDVPQPLVAEEDHVAGALRSPVPGGELGRLHRRDDAVAGRGACEVARGARLRDLAARRDR